jgi:hypothetical protein
MRLGAARLVEIERIDKATDDNIGTFFSSPGTGTYDPTTPSLGDHSNSGILVTQKCSADIDCVHAIHLFACSFSICEEWMEAIRRVAASLLAIWSMLIMPALATICRISIQYTE